MNFDIGDILRKGAELYGDRPALAYGDGTMSYAVLNSMSNCIANGLRDDKGITRGTQVVFKTGSETPGPEYVALIGALWKLGAKVAIFRSSVSLSWAHQQCGYLGVKSDHIVEMPEAHRGQNGTEIEQTAEPSDIAFQFYTSGSRTGVMKCVQRDRSNVEKQIASCIELLGVQEHDNVLAIRILSDQPSLYRCFATLAVGGTFHLPDQLCSHDVVPYIAKKNINILVTVPVVIGRIMREYWKENNNLRRVIFTGKHMEPGLSAKFKKRYPNAEIVETYAMTEVAAIAANYVPLSDVQIKIKDDVVCIKTPRLAQSYLRDGEIIPITVDEDGYYASEDLGHFDDEGRLVLTGRTPL